MNAQEKEIYELFDLINQDWRHPINDSKHPHHVNAVRAYLALDAELNELLKKRIYQTKLTT
ncbi:MAG: hypothetical protein LUQ56_10525 [Methylococcaceae bacterium]|jgi:hypothetical protein|nr:hypothetical protein [Methylococcaceae bacterium]MDD1638548.1 hypothetical protein [Methylococcaceae bacterium]